LKGHSSNPGIRVSMYNAMDVEGVEKLIELMKDFEAETFSPR
jgi:phosphoserine aminotransferase